MLFVEPPCMVCLECILDFESVLFHLSKSTNCFYVEIKLALDHITNSKICAEESKK